MRYSRFVIRLAVQIYRTDILVVFIIACRHDSEIIARNGPDHRLLDRLDALSDHLALRGDKGFPEIFLTVGLV